MRNPATKYGARNSASDADRLQKIHDLSVENGAACSPETAKSAAAAILQAGLETLAARHKSLKSLNYSAVEAWDIQSGAQALSMLSSLASSEAAQGEAAHVEDLGRIIKALLAWISGELSEMLQAASTAQTEPDEAPAMLSSKVMSLAYVKSLRLPRDEEFFRDVTAVKSAGQDEIRGYSMLWGSPTLTDTDVEFFTAKSDFWDSLLGKSARPLTWDHAQDPATKGAAVIGQIVDFGDDDVGRWYVAQLERAHKYRKAIDALISQHALGTSSDSAPQYVIREKAGKAIWIKQWPWFASALTTTPAEPRMFDAGSLYWKSAGLTGRMAALNSAQIPEDLLREGQLIKARIGAS